MGTTNFVYLPYISPIVNVKYRIEVVKKEAISPMDAKIPPTTPHFNGPNLVTNKPTTPPKINKNVNVIKVETNPL